jgi:predicted transcriptional regulator
VYGFRQESLRSLQDAVDHVISLRRREQQDEKDRRHREAMKEEIGILLRATGGRTFQEVLEAFDMDEVLLEEIMQEMIDEGAIEAKQNGHIVIYTLAVPMARSLVR